MKSAFRIPIRLKILVSLLFIVTAVVSTITFTMANMFHGDKRAYINDLVSMIALGTAEECRSLLDGYAGRLRVYATILADEELLGTKKSSVVRGLFREFPELVAIAVHEGDRKVVAAHNAAALEAGGLDREAVTDSREQLRASWREIPPGDVAVRNATLDPRLPAMVVATLVEQGESERPLVVSAMIRLDTMMRLAERAGAFRVFVVDADGIPLAHSERSIVTAREAEEIDPAVQGIHDQRSAGMNLEFERAGEQILGAYSSVDVGGVIAGAEIPSSVAYLASRDLLRRLLYVSLGLLVFAAVVGLAWARRLTRPVERLSVATRELARGRFDVKVAVQSRDEIGTLATSFNRMASELQDAQSQLIQSEKMAAFGELGAGVAHEVKNPLAGILGCAQLALRKAERDTMLYENLKLIEKETKRCKTIIENMLKFARQEKTVLKPIELNPVVTDAAAIVNHQLELSKVKLKVELAEGLPRIRGNANQLQQVLMNFMLNAQQAMEGRPGNVRVTTGRAGADHLQVVVADDGPGMTEEVKRKLFEPFFTTKPGGKGTGLGLSVSFGIVKDHAAEIEVDSSPGEGATFTVRIPVLDESTVPVEEAKPATPVGVDV